MHSTPLRISTVLAPKPRPSIGCADDEVVGFGADDDVELDEGEGVVVGDGEEVGSDKIACVNSTLRSKKLTIMSLRASPAAEPPTFVNAT